MRDRLIKLIKQAKKHTKNANSDIERDMIFADYLLANGVTLSTDDPIQLMTSMVEKIEKNMEKFFEKIEHPIGKIIVAAIVKEVLISAIEEVQEEAEQKLKEGKG